MCQSLRGIKRSSVLLGCTFQFLFYTYEFVLRHPTCRPPYVSVGWLKRRIKSVGILQTKR